MSRPGRLHARVLLALLVPLAAGTAQEHRDSSRAAVPGRTSFWLGAQIDLVGLQSGPTGSPDRALPPILPGRLPNPGTPTMSGEPRLNARFGRAVRTRRAEAGYSQESFADAIHLHRTHMGTMERGEGNPTLTTVLRVAQGLDMTVGELFMAVEERGQPQSP